jgi:hypothetical protein
VISKKSDMMSDRASLKGLLCTILALVIVMGVVFAANVVVTDGYHPLSQISLKNGNQTSADSNNDGMIDWANNAVSSQDCMKDNLCEMNAALVSGNMSVQDRVAIGDSINPLLKLFVNGGDVSFMNGRVGIGTASPSQKLHVIGNISVEGDIYGGALGSTRGIWRFSTNYPDYGIFYTESSIDYISFSPNGGLNNSPVMVVKSDGRVGINKTDPGAYTLYVNGPVYGSSLNSGGGIVAAGSLSVIGNISGSSLSVTGAISGSSLSVTNAISGGAISGTSLNVSTGSIIGGAISGTSLSAPHSHTVTLSNCAWDCNTWDNGHPTNACYSSYHTCPTNKVQAGSDQRLSNVLPYCCDITIS